MRSPSPLRVVALLALVAVAACGGGGGGDDADVSADATSASAPADLESCLAEQGVELPAGDPGSGVPGPGAAPDDDLRAAMEACQQYAPSGGSPAGGGAAFEAYRDCLADEGVDLPEPDSSSGPPPSIDREDPDLAAAQAACADLQPAPPEQSSTTTTEAHS